MDSIVLIISLIFIVLMFAYMLLAISIFKLNRKEELSKIFIFICLGASIWSFGYAMANLAESSYESLFWRRIAALGWTSIYSFILHFSILLLNQNSSRKKKSTYLLLYIPALINMYIFSISNTMATVQYNMIKIDYGWINKPVNNLWDYEVYLYSTIYILASLTMFWRWKEQVKNQKIKKQVNYFIIANMAIFILGTIIDVVVSSISRNPLPQISPIFFLLPVGFLYKSAKYDGSIKLEKKSKEEVIVTQQDQINIFNKIAITFLIGSVITFVSGYVPYIRGKDNELKFEIINALILLTIGLGLSLIQRVKQQPLKKYLDIAILLISLPLIMFRFIENGGVTVWIFPIVLMMSSLLFTKRTLLFLLTAVAIVIQRVIWIFQPEVSVIIDQYHYIARMIIFAIAYVVGSYINETYICKIEENNYQIELQKITSEISFDLMTLNRENYIEKTNRLLSKIGLTFKADKVYIILADPHKQNIIHYGDWGLDHKGEVDINIDEISIKKISWCIEELESSKFLYIQDINKLPESVKSEYNILIDKNTKSLILIPIKEKDKVIGFIGLNSEDKIKTWSQQDKDFLNVFANILASAISKIKIEREIEFMAYFDSLTKLPNKILFQDRVEQAIKLSKREGKSLSIVFIDLDDFKIVNDTIGHSGGDALLLEVSRRILLEIRESDTLSRFGGDEFMVLLNDINQGRDVEKIVKNIIGIFEQAFVINKQHFLLTASLGISRYPVDGEDPQTLIKNADMAMYRSKTKGKNQFQFCSKEMKENIGKGILLSNDLYHAIDKDQLIVYYQPQVNLKTGEIDGLEALLRWNHPKFGMISPGVFIPLAEKNNLINGIGHWVLKTACSQNKKWHEMGLNKVAMAVNLSAVQFMNSKITNDIKGILEETGLDPKFLEIEITESVAIKQTDLALIVLNKLKEIGVSISIDDFGTEYSSLSRLKVLPIDRIKIDMQFIQGIENDEKDRAITMVVINLAKNLGLNVIAEGVETQAQVDFLIENQCDHMQGYYYYRPMPACDLEKILVDNSFKKLVEKTVN